VRVVLVGHILHIGHLFQPRRNCASIYYRNSMAIHGVGYTVYEGEPFEMPPPWNAGLLRRRP
jgi:hypothetical protein